MMDGKGVRISADRAWGRAVEVDGRNHYFRKYQGTAMIKCDRPWRKQMWIAPPLR